MTRYEARSLPPDLPDLRRGAGTRASSFRVSGHFVTLGSAVSRPSASCTQIRQFCSFLPWWFHHSRVPESFPRPPTSRHAPHVASRPPRRVTPPTSLHLGATATTDGRVVADVRVATFGGRRVGSVSMDTLYLRHITSCCTAYIHPSTRRTFVHRIWASKETGFVLVCGYACVGAHGTRMCD